MNDIKKSVQEALAEDIGQGDISAALVSEHIYASAILTNNQSMILCGKDWFDMAFLSLNPLLEIAWFFDDGDAIESGQILCKISGRAQEILIGERVALNFLQTLSATATITNAYTKKIKKAKLLDTRKTIPHLRLAQKYATRVGGAHNHRINLHDAFLIKENHIFACGSIAAAVSKARAQAPDKLIQVEVETLAQLKEALDSGCGQVMLDNFSIDAIYEAVKINQKHVKQTKLEASGNIHLDNIGAYDATGVDYISVGGLTKHICAIDLSLRLHLEDRD